MKNFILIILILLPILIFGQNIKRGDKHFVNLEYSMAIKHYHKVFQKKNNYEAAVKLGHCYKMLNNTAEAEKWYVTALNFSNYKPALLLDYAQALKMNGKYAEAKSFFLMYAQESPSDAKKAEWYIEACSKAMEWQAASENIVIEKFKNLNSHYSDFCPVKYENGIAFTSDRLTDNNQDISGWTGSPYLKMYYTQNISEDSWTEAVELDEKINFKFHNGPAAFSPRFDTIYFTRVIPVKKRIKIKTPDPTSWLDEVINNQKINHSGIYFSVKKNGKWGEAIAFLYNNPLEYSVGHPTLSTDGKILYFSSNMPGGFGGSDLYYSMKKEDGSWDIPKNLGSAINTSGKECFPAIGTDGILYFSSDGHHGMGGLDLFKARGTMDRWGEVENMKAPVNSSQDDFGILFNPDGVSGYLSSSRGDSYGKDNIFSFQPAPPKKRFIVIRGRTVNAEENILSNVLVQVAETLPEASTLAEFYSGSDGKFLIKVPYDENYLIKGEKQGFKMFEHFVSVSTDKDTIDIEIMLEMNINTFAKKSKPEPIEKKIYFDLDMAAIRKDAAAELDKIVGILNSYENMRLEISSHTDCRASDSYNFLLSQRRAEATVNYLIKKGADKGRISAECFGKTKLINHCKEGVSCDEELHQQNRRVEIRIIVAEPVTPTKYTIYEENES
jgi:outer membrane protein OmpA-like peptidoglycan-associated protein/tetratricopeptide (TPR) repeat protein